MELREEMEFQMNFLSDELDGLVLRDSNKDKRFIEVNQAIEIAKEYAREMCEKQKKICFNEWMNARDIKQVEDKILNAPLPREIEK